ncbi:hypothetical protein SY83_19825 [Paenibacillus swuensis]|uniref:CN hydrolase domain-containing protein n=1 Tax=Paenibacillus swuensis TaxID=1178515 RepID=A0A172TMX2_9BACL|nr:hypothetical protein [Paenibacillus swuensis]ANE48167.1 hypothetical protein SY83_19825 [Paenibacillus swuensis]
MKILIGQPKLEKTILQLINEIQAYPEVDIMIYPEGYLNENVAEACEWARKCGTMIISGYKKPKDRAIMINHMGQVVLDKAKYEPAVYIEQEGLRMGHLLCDELVLQGLGERDNDKVDFVAHPIGVGMFSENQFDVWIQAAKELAMAHHTIIIGTSHADGSFGGGDVSIPIAYAINADGESIFIRKNDTRSVILDLEDLSYTVMGEQKQMKESVL